MALLPIPTDLEAWHALRAQHVGASEVSALFAAEPAYASGVYALWQEKAGRIPRRQVDNPRTRAGLALEVAIAQLAADQEGWDVSPGLYASRDGLGATLDRIIPAPGPADGDVQGPGVLELKNVDWLVHKRSWGGEPPIHILLQLQAQLAASGFTWGAIAALVGGNELKVYRYQARWTLHAEIMQRVASFWQSIEDGKPPRPDGSDATYQAILQLVPEIDRAEIDLSGNNRASIVCADYLRHAAAEKAAKAAKNEARNEILELLGHHDVGLLEGFQISAADIEGRPPRPAKPGEIIPGRAHSRRITVKEWT